MATVSLRQVIGPLETGSLQDQVPQMDPSTIHEEAVLPRGRRQDAGSSFPPTDGQGKAWASRNHTHKVLDVGCICKKYIAQPEDSNSKATEILTCGGRRLLFTASLSVPFLSQ